MRCNTSWVCGGVIALGLLGALGCQTVPVGPTTANKAALQPIAAALPQGLAGAQMELRRDKALTKAQMPLAEILASLPRPGYLKESSRVVEGASGQVVEWSSGQVTETDAASRGANIDANANANANADADANSKFEIQNSKSSEGHSTTSLPPEVLRAYTAGRLAWRAGQTAEAINQLNSALRLLPDQPEVLALLGRIHLLTLNQRARGVLFLEQAVAGDPADVESLFLLGRSAWEQGQWDQAIVLLAELIERKPEIMDAGMGVLTRHLLGTALERHGYDVAAAQQFTAYLDQQAPFSRTSTYQRELLLLNRQKPQLWQNVGDLWARVGRWDDAAKAYARSAELDDPQDRPGLTARLAYVNLRLGQKQAAADAVLDFLESSPSDPRGVELLSYLRGYELPSALFVERLKQVYANANKPEGLALALAELSDKRDGQRLLQEHLTDDPTAWRAFAKLLQLAMQEEQSRSSSGKNSKSSQRDTTGLRGALLTTQKAIEKTPRAAGAYTQALFETMSAGQVEQAVQGLRESGRSGAGLLYLSGQAALREQRWLAAEIALREALTLEPVIPAAQLDLVRVLLAQRQWDHAGKALEGVTEKSVEAVGLRVQWLEATDKRDEAMALLDEQLKQQPMQADYLIAKALLLLQSDEQLQAQEAERLLLTAVEATPTQERLYQVLFAMYDRERVPNAARQRVALLRKGLQHLPGSRLMRIKLAEEQLRANDLAEARRQLENLLTEQPDDLAAVQLMLIVLHRSGQGDAAQLLLDRHVTPTTTDKRWLILAQQFYAGTGQREKALAMFERLALQAPAGARRDLQLASLYLQTDRAAQAVELLGKTVDTWPVRVQGKGASENQALPTIEQAGGQAASAEESADAEDADAPGLDQALGLLSRGLLRLNRGAEIDPLFERMLRKHPSEEADLRFEWAMMLQRMQQGERSEKQLMRVLELTPSDARVLNALGYAWAERGVRLEEAKKMIQQALVKEPENAAYLDSLGWVLYKQGEFDKAVEQLTKARMRPGGDHPVILDHLGDALWRAGRKTEAVRYWQVALEGITEEMMKDDPEVVQLKMKLPGKIEAAGANQEPATAERHDG